MRKIVLWGISGSGKTMFLLSLLKALYQFGPDMGWTINILPPTDSISEEFQTSVMARFFEKAEYPARTLSLISIAIELRRIGFPSQQQVNHEISIVDAPGDRTYNDQAYLAELFDADAILCLIDVSSGQRSYLKGLPPLKLHFPFQRLPVEPLVAFCLAKSDRYFSLNDIASAYEHSVSQKQVFRSLIANIIDPNVLLSIEQAFPSPRTRYFPTSSVGWAEAKHGGYFPNRTALINQAAPVIYQPSVWRPWGILETLFWLLDSLDLAHLDPGLEIKRYEPLLRLYWKWKSLSRPNEVSFHQWLTRQGTF